VDVAYVAIVVRVCCKCLSSIFHLFFFVHVSLQVFHTHVSGVLYLLSYVASVTSGCLKSRSGYCTHCNGVSTICLKCFICFRRMLQIFHMNVVKVVGPIAAGPVHTCRSERAQAAGVENGNERRSRHARKQSDVGLHRQAREAGLAVAR
jgi:hypothetical protein